MKRITAEIEAEIVRLHAAEHWPIGTIARQLEIHHSVVRRVLGRRELVGPTLSARPSIVDPYLPFIRETLAMYPTLSSSREVAVGDVLGGRPLARLGRQHEAEADGQGQQLLDRPTDTQVTPRRRAGLRRRCGCRASRGRG